MDGCPASGSRRMNVVAPSSSYTSIRLLQAPTTMNGSSYVRLMVLLWAVEAISRRLLPPARWLISPRVEESKAKWLASMDLPLRSMGVGLKGCFAVACRPVTSAVEGDPEPQLRSTTSSWTETLQEAG